MATIDSANLNTDADGGIPSGDDSGTVASASGPLNPNAEPQRKRGRPRKDAGTASSGGSARDSAADTSSRRTETPSEKAGQKRTGQKSLDLSGYGEQIQGLHAMAAVALKNPIIEISRSQADQLAIALSDVMKQYSINVNPAALAWIKLIGISATIYGPKILLTNAIKAEQRKTAQPAPVAAPQSNAPSAPVVTANPGQGKMVFQ